MSERAEPRPPGPLLDVVLGYDCNLGCTYCTLTSAMRERSTPTAVVRRAMRQARADGHRRISFTGGEPTIRPALLPLVREARALGFEEVKVQTNGLLFATEGNLPRLIDAGATRIHVSLHAHREGDYERIVRRPGSHPLLVQALDRLGAASQRGDVLGHADLIVLRETKAWLAAAIDFVADRGLRSVYLWSFSATDAQRDRTGEVLSFAEAMPAVREAFARGAARGVNVRTLHIPHCVLGDDAHRGMDPTAEPVRVVTPDAVFDLRDSPLSPSVRVASCEGCWRANACKGARRDYLEVHGPQEILDAASRFAPPEIS